MSELTLKDWLAIIGAAFFILVCVADIWLTYKGKKLP